MKLFWNQTKPFLIPFIITWAILLCIVLSTDKMSLHLAINQYHSAFGDFFFSYYTHVGGGIFVLLVVAALLFYKYSAALFVLTAQLLTVAIIYPLKHTFAIERPLLLFEQHSINLHYLKDFLLKDSLSFPSGHTGAAFALFLSLTMMVDSRLLKFLFFVLAALVGYSRVYLCQHFTEDVLGGSMIGVLAVLIAYFACWPYLQKHEKLGDSLRCFKK
jgi:membrane-associated phospholipid phosphatase